MLRTASQISCTIWERSQSDHSPPSFLCTEPLLAVGPWSGHLPTRSLSPPSSDEEVGVWLRGPSDSVFIWNADAPDPGQMSECRGVGSAGGVTGEATRQKHSFTLGNKYLSSACCVQDTALGPGDLAVSRTDKVPVLSRLRTMAKSSGSGLRQSWV